jgi:hypothetical protein
VATETEILIRQIQDLTENLADLGRTVVSVDEEIMAKFGVTVDRNTQMVEKNTKAQQKSIKLVDQFGRELESATDAVEENTKAQTLSNKEIIRHVQARQRERSASNELFKEFGRGVSVTGLLRDRFEDLGGESLVATTGLKAVTAGLEGLTRATVKMASAIYQGERGTALSAKALTELVKPVSELATTVGTVIAVLSLFGPAGLIGRGMKIFGAAVGALGIATQTAAKFNEIAAEQTDKLHKSFNALSKSGVVAAGGLDTVFAMAQTMGLSVAELEKFNQLLSDNIQSLSVMGATAGAGADKFAQASGRLIREFGRELELMGVDRDEQREIAMSYMNIQARTGQLLNKSINQLAKESAEYVKELDMLAEITGTNRKAQQEAREAALTETRFRAAMIDAERSGNQQRMRELQVAQRASAMARAAGDVRGATGLLQEAAGGGALSTVEAIAASQTYRLQELLARNPNPTDVEIAQHMGRSVELQQDQLASFNALGGSIDVLQTDFVKSADFARRQAVLLEEAAKAGFEGNQGIQNYLEAIQAGRIKATPETQAVINAGRAQQNAAMMMDSSVRTFNGAAELSMAASKAFAEAVKIMPGSRVNNGLLDAPGVTVPGSAPVPGNVQNMARPSTARRSRRAGGNVQGSGNLASGAGGGFNPYADLRLKSAEAVAGGQSMMATYQFAKQVQDALGDDLLYFSAFNDTYDKRIGVGHKEGRAFDMVLKDPSRSKEVAGVISSMLGGRGKVIDEYLNPVQSTTGGHLHIELAKGYRNGGIATGPQSGYSTVLHGTEAVVPLPDGRTIPVEMPSLHDGMREQVSMMREQVTRLDELINVMRTQNTISSKILAVSQN